MIRWLQHDDVHFVMNLSGRCTTVCDVSSKLKILESVILFLSIIITNTSKVVRITISSMLGALVNDVSYDSGEHNL
jgi:hypothetical protein